MLFGISGRISGTARRKSLVSIVERFKRERRVVPEGNSIRIVCNNLKSSRAPYATTMFRSGFLGSSLHSQSSVTYTSLSTYSSGSAGVELSFSIPNRIFTPPFLPFVFSCKTSRAI